MPPKTEERKQERLKRKRVLAAQQVQQFEDEQSRHELNLARLNAVPEADRDAGHAQAVKEAEKALEIVKSAIETTLAEVEKLPT